MSEKYGFFFIQATLMILRELYSKLFFGKVNCRFYIRKFHFIATWQRKCKTQIAAIKPTIYLPKRAIFNTVIPTLMPFFTFSSFKVYYFAPITSAFSSVNLNQTSANQKGRFIVTSGFNSILQDILSQIFNLIQSDTAL